MRPDSPCIAVCTTLYDVECKGCGRTYEEVAQWNAMTPEEKEAIWVRIESENRAWRFNRYRDRVKETQRDSEDQVCQRREPVAQEGRACG